MHDQSPEDLDLILRKITQAQPDVEPRCLHASSLVELPPHPDMPDTRCWLLRTVTHTQNDHTAVTMDMLLGEEDLAMLAHVVGSAMAAYLEIPLPVDGPVAPVIPFPAPPKPANPSEN